MNKFIVILSDRNEQHLRERFLSCAETLRKTSPKVLEILPHILLFQTEKDFSSAFASLPKELRQDGQALLFQIHDGFRGSASIGRNSDLEDFFE